MSIYTDDKLQFEHALRAHVAEQRKRIETFLESVDEYNTSPRILFDGSNEEAAYWRIEIYRCNIDMKGAELAPLADVVIAAIGMLKGVKQLRTALPAPQHDEG